jgi:hypothetical protein
MMFSNNSSNGGTPGPTRAMKILWKSGANDPVIVQHQKQEQQGSAEQMIIQNRDFDRIREALEVSKEWLPNSMKEFNGWRVGLLARFEAIDLNL